MKKPLKAATIPGAAYETEEVASDLTNDGEETKVDIAEINLDDETKLTVDESSHQRLPLVFHPYTMQRFFSSHKNNERQQMNPMKLQKGIQALIPILRIRIMKWQSWDLIVGL